MNREPVDALGEVFMRLPFLRALRAWGPEARITIVPGIGGASFWEELVRPISASLVDETIRDRLPQKPRSFDWVFDMQGASPNLLFSEAFSARLVFHNVAAGLVKLSPSADLPR